MFVSVLSVFVKFYSKSVCVPMRFYTIFSNFFHVCLFVLQNQLFTKLSIFDKIEPITLSNNTSHFWQTLFKLTQYQNLIRTCTVLFVFI